jgi:tRNA-specific 2-thiouridylase
MGGGNGERRYALAVDTVTRQVTVGPEAALLTDVVEVDGWRWTRGHPEAVGVSVGVQVSAHGAITSGVVSTTSVTLAEPIRRVAPGQSVVLYRDDRVLGGGTAR